MLPADRGRPRRSALQDRDRPTTDLELDADLVAQTARDAAVAIAPDPGQVELGQDGLRCDHEGQSIEPSRRPGWNPCGRGAVVDLHVGVLTEAWWWVIVA
jgi:hypothetical protein